MNKREQIKLSSFMTKILRHDPTQFGVVLDEFGFCEISALTRAISAQAHWREVSESNLLDIAKTCRKQRYLVEGTKIKARYGHSIPIRQESIERQLPAYLYHGTHEAVLERIRSEGILPMARHRIHLSETHNFASLAAKRRKTPYLLKVDTQLAISNGTEFQFAGNEVWLATSIPAQAITEEIALK